MTPDDLSPQTEEVLRRAQQGAHMSATHKRRLKGAVLARLAVASTATLAVGQGAATAMGVGFVAKTVVGIALVVSLGAGGYLALRPAPARPAPRVVALPAPAEVVAPEPPAPPAAKPAPALPAHVHRPVERRAAPEETSDLAVETAMLRDADRALRTGDTATALARLDEHATRFPNGALAPERAGERLVVLCQVGVADARVVSQFLADHAGSPLAARVRRACAPKP